MLNSTQGEQIKHSQMIPKSGTEKFEDPQNDSVWILSSTFIIFTMQSGE